MERQCGSSYTINQASRLRGTHYLHYWACAGGSLFLVKEGRAKVRNPGVDCPALLTACTRGGSRRIDARKRGDVWLAKELERAFCSRIVAWSDGRAVGLMVKTGGLRACRSGFDSWTALEGTLGCTVCPDDHIHAEYTTGPLTPLRFFRCDRNSMPFFLLGLLVNKIALIRLF